MKHSFLALLGAAVIFSQQAKAAEPYVAINLGGAIDTHGDDSNVMPTIGVAVGMKNIARQGPVTLRAEVEVQLSIQDESAPVFVSPTVDEEAVTVAAFANLWLDYQPLKETPITLSVGGGIGLALTYCDLCIGSGFGGGQVSDTTDVNFAFNLGVAAAYQVSQGWELGGSVRYFDYGTVSDRNSPGFFLDVPVVFFQGSLPRRGVQAMATLRYTFGSIDF